MTPARDPDSGPGSDSGPEPAPTPGRDADPSPQLIPEPDPDPVRDPWAGAMRLALAEAVRAPETGDVPVGAVVLAPDGTVLSRTRNTREATGDPTAHAELLALREAARTLGTGDWRLSGCTLVVTLEPCTMCAGAGVLARVDRVVYGALDPKAGAAGSLWDVLRDRRLNHRPEVVHGVLASECAALLTRFFRTSPGTPPAGPPDPPDTDFDPRPPLG